MVGTGTSVGPTDVAEGNPVGKTLEIDVGSTDGIEDSEELGPALNETDGPSDGPKLGCS